MAPTQSPATARDPVRGMNLDPNEAAVTRVAGGETLYFRSERRGAQFDRDHRPSATTGVAAQAKYERPRHKTAFWTAMSTAAEQELTNALIGKKASQQALKDVQGKIEAILAGA